MDDLEKRVKILEDDNLALRRRMNLKDAISELISKQDELVQIAKDMMAYDEELAQSPDIKNSKLWSGLVNGESQKWVFNGEQSELHPTKSFAVKELNELAERIIQAQGYAGSEGVFILISSRCAELSSKMMEGFPEKETNKPWTDMDMVKEGEKSAPAQCELCSSVGPPVGMNCPECGSSKDYGDILPLDKNVTNTTVGYFKELFNSPNLKDSTPVTFSLFHSGQELDTALEYQMSGGGDSGICIQLSEVEAEEDSQKPK